MTTIMHWFGIVLLSMIAVTSIAVWAWLVLEIFRDYRQSNTVVVKPPENLTPSPTFKLRSPVR